MPTCLRDHWHWRPEWRCDRPRYWWYLTFATESPLHQVARRFQQHVSGIDSLDLVPLEWLHLTLQDVGFVHELAPGQASALRAAAADAVSDLPALRLALGPLRTMNSAVVLEAHPTDELVALRHRLRTALAAVRAPDVPGPVEFHPHVSLAYVNRECDASDVLDPLRDVPMPTAHVSVGKVTLAAVTRRNRAYRWEPVAEVPLRGSGRAADGQEDWAARRTWVFEAPYPS